MLRATLKSLLSRKLRLVLSGIAVILGVMFVAGALVMTDTLGRSFDNLFTNVYEFTQIQVQKVAPLADIQGQPVPDKVPASAVSTVEGVPGVKSAKGQVFLDGARVLSQTGRALAATGPRFGANWIGETELLSRRDGRGPTADTEVALSSAAAKAARVKVGDSVSVLTKDSKKHTFTVSGIYGFTGGRDSLAGETIVWFTEPVAQQLMLGQTGVFTDIDVKAADGVSLSELRDRIKAALGTDYTVRTGAELAADSANAVNSGLKFFDYVLLGFAGVALFVGIFLILNTFSIIVAQRTRELALFRALGASQRQVVGSVLTEAVVIGLLASTIGLLLGIGIGAGLGALVGSLFSGGQLQLASLGVPASAVIASYSVGIGITVLAALLPALRASRVAPVAAMRDSTIPDRPLTRLTVLGTVVLAAGGTALGLSLSGKLGGATLVTLLAGLIGCFIGVALLTPAISRPIVGLLGRILGWSTPGELGRRNSARNPRRTAITAAALMVSIALVTAVSVVLSSIQKSTIAAVDKGLHADLVIAADPTSRALGAIDPAAVDQIAALPGVASLVAIYGDVGEVDGERTFVGAVNNLPAAIPMFSLKPISGTLALSPGTILVDESTAKDRHLTAGSTVSITLVHATARTYTVAGVYSRGVVDGYVIPLDDAKAGFSSTGPMQGFVSLTPGTNVQSALSSVDNVLRDSPEVTVQTIDDYIAQQSQIFSFIIAFVQIMLGLAMLIAVLGIINTLALSMIERTRELGLLRAIGLKRRQVAWMVTVESVVISVFGALLGLAVGVGLGAAIVFGLRDQGFTDFALPVPLMVGYLIASVFVGLIAALLPGIRAARSDVLKAIAYE